MNSNNPITIAITDASCLIILDKIGYLQLLPKLFEVIVTTPQIANKLVKPLPD